MTEENAALEGEVVEPVEAVENADIPENTEAATEEAKPEKNNLQKRIDKITRDKYEAYNERDQLAKENEQLKAKLDNPIQPTQEPTLEGFDYDESAFNQAVIAKAVQDQVAKATEETMFAQQKAAKEKQMIEEYKTLATKEAEFAGKVEDYDQVAKNPNLPINDNMADIIRTSDQGPALLYHLGKNPEMAYNIANMDQMSAQRELLRVEASLDNKPNLVSNAPDPAPNIGGENTVSQDPEDMSIEEWVKWRNKQAHG